MNFEAWVVENESTVRLSFFIGIFLAVALWELLSPRRLLLLSRWLRWSNNLALVALNTAILRLLFPLAAVGVAATAATEWWGLLNHTDLSAEILSKASAGVYSQFEVQRGLPIQLLVKYFEKQDDQWQISQELRDMVTYKEYNLLNNLAPLGKFDVVFCRNVLIYFDKETKGQVLGSIADLMPQDGTLFLGGAETVLGISDRFKPVPEQRGVYGIA